MIYAMSGASEAHNIICGKTVTELNVRLRETDCKVYPSDLKVRVPNSRKFFYPDASVVCEEAKFADDQKDVLLNPVLVVEVLSDSTAAYDRGKKFQAYQQIESLQEYVLIAQDEQIIELFRRQADNSWRYEKVAGISESVTLASIDCRVALSEVYRRV